MGNASWGKQAQVNGPQGADPTTPAWVKRIPDLMTGLRILLASAMLLARDVLWLFWLLYFLCGITDVLDGLLARRLNAQTLLGARLDSGADAAFAAALALSWLPRQRLPLWALAAAAGIALIKLCSGLLCRIRFGEWSFLHTYLSKAAGAAVFAALPLTELLPLKLTIGPACAVAAVAALEELIVMARLPRLDRNVRGVFHISGDDVPPMPRGKP